MAYNLESFVQILKEILCPDEHGLPWILDDAKKPLIESLLAKACFLKDFFDNSWSVTGREIRRLEGRIRDVAYHAETIIQSHLVQQQLVSRKKGKKVIISPPDQLQEIEDTEFERIIDDMGRVMDGRDITRSSSSNLLLSKKDFNPKNIIVGIDEDLIQMKAWLTSDQSKLEVMPIVGMGGIGKTTLAHTLYHDSVVVSHFDARAWVVVSQTYSVREILFKILRCVLQEQTIDDVMEKNKNDLALCLHQTLWGRRYLIVLDDVWSSESWDDIKMSLSDGNNRSRILVTTREMSVANYASSRDTHHRMKFLNDAESFNLLHEKVFAEENFPPMLENIGKNIAKNCKGLPLAIHVVSGVLGLLEKTQEAWIQIAKDVHSSMPDVDEHFSNILSLSYVYLPNYLKPCFLYMSMFPEDYKIQASKLVLLWVAEGFLKPIPGRSYEEVAEIYLAELVHRNLLLVSTQEAKWKVKSYVMHDSLRHFCVKKAEEEQFFHVVTKGSWDFNLMEGLHLRRLNVRSNIEIMAIASSQRLANVVHSLMLTYFFRGGVLLDQVTVYYICGMRLLRILDILGGRFEEWPKVVDKLVNLRYLAVNSPNSTLPSSISSLCNLQTLIYHSKNIVGRVIELFQTPRLRHVKLKGCYLLCDLIFVDSIPLQETLQTLSTVVIDESFPKILAAIPNLTKLGVCHREETPSSCNIDLRCLIKLETLKCSGNVYPSGLNFPNSLRKLTLKWCVIPWYYKRRIEVLPNLQILKLWRCKFERQEWEPTEGEFRNLQILALEYVDLKKWIVKEPCFPRLEHLIIRDCDELEEIPSRIGEILSLETIEVHGSMTDSALKSLRDIRDEQLDYGNYALQVHINAYNG